MFSPWMYAQKRHYSEAPRGAGVDFDGGFFYLTSTRLLHALISRLPFSSERQSGKKIVSDQGRMEETGRNWPWLLACPVKGLRHRLIPCCQYPYGFVPCLRTIRLKSRHCCFQSHNHVHQDQLVRVELVLSDQPPQRCSS